MRYTYLLFVFCLILTFSCRNNNDVQSNLYEISYKEKIKEYDSLKEKVFFDTISNIYINDLYNISMDFPNHWEVDMGTSNNTLVRGFERDSGITFTIVPIELKKGSKAYIMQNRLMEFYDSDVELFEKVMKNNLEKNLRTKILSYKTNKSYLKNQPTIKSIYKSIMRDLDVEYEMTTITHNFWKQPYSYTISLSLPSKWYEKAPNKYDWLYTNFFFTQ